MQTKSCQTMDFMRAEESFKNFQADANRTWSVTYTRFKKNFICGELSRNFIAHGSKTNMEQKEI